MIYLPTPAQVREIDPHQLHSPETATTLAYGLRPKVLQDFREGIYTKYDEGHTSVVGLQYPNVDQSSRVQLDFNPADTVCGL